MNSGQINWLFFKQYAFSYQNSSLFPFTSTFEKDTADFLKDIQLISSNF